MKQLILVCSLAGVLAACSSPVRLDDVPVQDKTGTAVDANAKNAAATSANGGNVAQSGVAPVDLGKTAPAGAGPAGTRIIYFDYDSYSVRPDDQGTIETNARYLKTERSRKAVIEGHTDDRGGREYNLALGQKRSEAVRRSLSSLGVPDAQIEAVSLGKEKPAAQGSDEAAFAKNRRAEITYR